MSEDQQAHTTFTRLPNEFVDRFTKPFSLFLRTESAAGAVLLLSIVAALVAMERDLDPQLVTLMVGSVSRFPSSPCPCGATVSAFSDSNNDDRDQVAVSPHIKSH